MKRIALGLSGGVDSAISAYLLKKQGFDVSCIYLNCYDADVPGCRTKTDRADALKVALHLKLPFQVLDFRKEYQAAVIDYFKEEYLTGRTPNPDVVCNRDIKFGLFLDWAIKNHFDYVSTGHYAKLNPVILRSESRTTKDPAAGDTNIPIGRSGLDSSSRAPQNDDETQKVTPVLRIPRDRHKDQTYFLWQVPREKFQHVLFPLANYLKSEVREIARKIKLPVADKKDSTGICFIGEISVEEFLKRLGVKEKRGEVVIKKTRNSNLETRNNQSKIRKSKNQKQKISFENSDLEFVSNFGFRASNFDDDYEVIGTHKGVWFYTIGQRHGFELLASPIIHPERVLESKGIPFDRPPLYVISKDIKTNRLVVGFGSECYRDSFEVSQCNWLTSLDEKNSKFESRNSKQSIQNSNDKNFKQKISFENSDLEFVSNFGFRASDLPLYVRLRHCGDLIPCRIERSDLKTGLECPEGRTLLGLKVRLSIPQRGLASGQSAVFYNQSGLVLGGGIIQ